MTTSQQPDSSYRQVFNTALRILTGRDHSKAELLHKLKQRGFAADDIERAVAECERLDYIDDERSARVYAEQLVRKGYGLKRIDYEMNKKGLKGERIQNIVSESVSAADELDGARRILNKNTRRFEREKDLKKRRNKIYRFLYSRGFSPDTIRKLMHNPWGRFRNKVPNSARLQAGHTRPDAIRDFGCRFQFAAFVENDDRRAIGGAPVPAWSPARSVISSAATPMICEAHCADFGRPSSSPIP